MAKKKEKQRKILPPLEEIIGGSTSDLVREALKKVMGPYPSAPEEPLPEDSSIAQLSESLPTTEPSSEDTQLQRNPATEKLRDVETELQQDPVTEELSDIGTELQDNRVIKKPSSRSRATKIPSLENTQFPDSSATVYPSKNYLITPQFLYDQVLPMLTPYEQALLLRLYRLSYGFKRKITDHVGKKTLADKCHMSLAMVKKVIHSLEGRALIETIEDRSNDPHKGNRYRVLTRFSDNPVLQELSSLKSKLPDSPIIIEKDDDNIKNKNHHLKEIKELYKNTTNNKWTKRDDDSFEKVKNYSTELIKKSITITFKRAKSPPNNFEYFVKQIKKFAKPTDEEKKILKKALGEMVNVTRQRRLGGTHHSTLEEDVLRICEQDGVFFDEELYKEILDESRYGRWDAER